MSRDRNQDILRKVIVEAFSKGNYSVLLECFPEEFIEHQFGLHNTIQGLEQDIRFLRKAFPDLELTIDEMVSDGDKVWARSTARGTNLGGMMGPPNGKKFTITVFDECRFEDGKIVEHWGSPDRFAQLVQLGVIPVAQPNPA
jgi:predicted ester cyclase